MMHVIAPYPGREPSAVSIETPLIGPAGVQVFWALGNAIAIKGIGVWFAGDATRQIATGIKRIRCNK